MSLKLLYITNGINGSGGLERVLSTKASLLATDFNYQVHILVLNNTYKEPFYQFSDKINFHSINVNGNPISYFIKYKKGIKRVLDNIQPDIISVCDDGLKGMLFPLIFGTKTPAIYERHASFDIFKKTENQSSVQKSKLSSYNLLIKYGAKKFDKFIVLTQNNLKEWNLPNLKVIPNPLPFYPKESATLSNKKVIAVGNHSFNKGFDRLLLIWKEIITKHPLWQLEIYGKKNANEELENLAKKYKIEKSVTFLNPVKNIQEKYLDASIFVLPSRSEGFGMVLIEAMACGVPCVAFDCPSGPKDIISDNKDGYIIENGNIESFIAALSILIENKDKRQTMGFLAKENVKRYLPNNIIPQWDKLFKSL